MGGRRDRRRLDAAGRLAEVVMDYERAEDQSARIWTHVYSSAYEAHVRAGEKPSLARMLAGEAAHDAVSGFLTKRVEYRTGFR